MNKRMSERRVEHTIEVGKWGFRWALGCFAAASLSAGLGCSAGGDSSIPPSPVVVSSGSDGTGGEGSTSDPGGAPLIELPPDGGAELPPDGGTGTVSTAEPTRCDENGENCKCIAIANIGEVGRRETDAFDTWLNTKSNARVASLPDEFTFDAATLEAYDILILQNISTWTVTDEEILAIQEWVEAGNGIMTLQGYSETSAEIGVVNAILEPLGIAYRTSPAGRGISLREVTEWNPESPIAANMVGFSVLVNNGRPVEDLDALGVPTLTQDNYLFGVTKEIAAGHAFVWADEWVTYSLQWTTEELFRAQQFWYNSITYLTPADACEVVIDDPHIIVR